MDFTHTLAGRAYTMLQERISFLNIDSFKNQTPNPHPKICSTHNPLVFNHLKLEQQYKWRGVYKDKTSLVPNDLLTRRLKGGMLDYKLGRFSTLASTFSHSAKMRQDETVQGACLKHD